MSTRTTFHLSVPGRALLIGYARAWLAQRDPLAAGSLAIVGLIIVLAVLRVGVLALLSAYPAATAAQSTPGPIILIATAQPLPTPLAAPTADPLRIEVESLRARVAELEQQPTAEPQLVYVEQQPEPPVQPLFIAPTPEPPAEPEPTAAPDPPSPAELDAAQQAERERNIQDRMRGNEAGGSGKLEAPTFPTMPPVSDSIAAQWCAGAAAAGVARCAP